MSNQPVPKIEVLANQVRSTSTCSPDVADFCASWSEEAKRMAKQLMKRDGKVYCLDSTAYSAMLSLSIAMMEVGLNVRAEIVPPRKEEQTA